MVRRIIWVMIVLFVCGGLYAQASRRIQAPEKRLYITAQVGVGYAQLNGDNYPGLSKGDLQIGFGVMTMLDAKTMLEIDFMHQRKGSRTETGSANGQKNRAIDLTYVELPLFMRHQLGDPTMGVFIEGGLVYGRLTKTTITEPQMAVDGYMFSVFEPYFNKNEISGLVGLGYAFSPNLGIRLRYQRAITPLFRASKQEIVHPAEAPSNETISFLRNELLGLQLYLRL